MGGRVFVGWIKLRFIGRVGRIRVLNIGSKAEIKGEGRE